MRRPVNCIEFVKQIPRTADQGTEYPSFMRWVVVVVSGGGKRVGPAQGRLFQRRCLLFKVLGVSGVALALAIFIPFFFSNELSQLEVSSERPTKSAAPELGWEPEAAPANDARARLRRAPELEETEEVPTKMDSLLEDLSERTAVVRIPQEDGTVKTLELEDGRWKRK